MKGCRGRFGPGAWDTAGDFSKYTPSAALSAQETSLRLNIDSLLHKPRLGGDGGCSAWFISLRWQTEIAGTLASCAPSCPGGGKAAATAAGRGKLRTGLSGGSAGSGRTWGAMRCC